MRETDTRREAAERDTWMVRKRKAAERDLQMIRERTASGLRTALNAVVCLFTRASGVLLVLSTISDAVIFALKIALPSEPAPDDAMDPYDMDAVDIHP